jgi:hypothetical protein
VKLVPSEDFNRSSIGRDYFSGGFQSDEKSDEKSITSIVVTDSWTVIGKRGSLEDEV